ncbi:MAG: DNA repair protein RecO [Myxococcaceae bacterium]|nr:DNA repair protein RecO [Myxococcaceae bacterium]
MIRVVDEALVLSSVDYGEADRIVTLFTRERGRVSAFAAGARKSKRRFAGALEAGTHLKAHLVERRGDTFRLDGVDVVQSFHHLRDDLPRIARLLYCLELIRELTRDHEPHTSLFDTLKDYLQLLDAKQAGPTSLLLFELDALAQAGFMPNFSPCALCGQPTGARPRFDPEHGGVVCFACAPRVPNGFPVSPEVVDALARLQAGARTPMAADLRARARELLNVFIAHHLGRKLKSVEFMEQVGAD